jgi:GGDEF domain-containing protein
MRVLAADIARGQLNTNPISPGNELASGLKSLQATLKHLTWQIHHIAEGDYKQRVSFIGEFSDAINNMVLQLDERTRALKQQADEMRAQANELRENYEMFVALAAHVDQWIIVLDRKTGETLFSNHRAADVLRNADDEPRMRVWLAERAKRYDRNLTGSLPAEVSFGEPELWSTHNRNRQFFSITAKPFTWQEHKALTFLVTDVTEARRRREELESVAFFDALTGAYSRHYGMNLLEQWLANGEPFSLCFVDMDNLKYVNDTFGHEAGDKYILDVSARLSSGDVKAGPAESTRSGADAAGGADANEGHVDAAGGAGRGAGAGVNADASESEGADRSTSTDTGTGTAADAGAGEGGSAGENAGAGDERVVLSRLGGDEFMLLCRGWDKKRTERWLESIRSDLIAKSSGDYQRSISYGVVEVAANEDRQGSLLLGLADELMYEYKRNRKMERRATATA